MPNNIETKVAEIIEEFAPIGSVELSSNLMEDLGLDSLDKVELVMNLEEEFGLDIPDDDADTFSTVADIVKYVTDAKDA